MAERPFEIPVLIVGGGPVGLACSLMLTRFGVRSLLVERHPSTSRHPKAMAIMQRTAELLRQWGVVDAMRTAGVPQDWLRQILFAQSLTGEAFGTVEVDSYEPVDVSPAQALRCPQTATEAILRQAAERGGLGTLRFGVEMTGFQQDEGGITATIRDRDSGRSESVRARYLLAADGAASGVREALGIARAGPGDMGHFVNIYHHADFGARLGDRKPFMANILSQTIGAGYVAVNGRDLWLLHLYLEPKDRPEDLPEAVAVDLVPSRWRPRRPGRDPLHRLLGDVGPDRPALSGAPRAGRRRRVSHHAGRRPRHEHRPAVGAQPGLEARGRAERRCRRAPARHLRGRAARRRHHEHRDQQGARGRRVRRRRGGRAGRFRGDPQVGGGDGA